MGRDTRGLRPVHKTRDSEYPSFDEYHHGRRRVLRWLGAGGAAMATAGLVGCDPIRDVLGLAPGPGRLAGDVACPVPPQPQPQPVGAGGETETETETEAERMAAPTETEAVTETETETETEAETEAETETERTAAPTEAETETETLIETESLARPEAHLRGDIAMPEPPPEEARPTRTRGKIRVVNPNEPKS